MLGVLLFSAVLRCSWAWADIGIGSNTTSVAAKECHLSWINYRIASTAWLSSNATQTTSTITEDTTYFVNVGTGIPYKDSTGIDRFANHSNTAIETSVLKSLYTTTSLATWEVTRTAPFPRPTPICSINRDDCDVLLNEYYAKSESDEDVRLVQNGTPFRYEPEFPECIARKCECVVQGENIRLIHWGSNDRNSATNSVFQTDVITLISTTTNTMSESILRSGLSTTIITGNFAFTSPSLYLAYATLRAEVYCPLSGPMDFADFHPSTTGGLHTASIVALNPEDLYSVVFVFPNFHGDETEYALAMARGSFQNTYGRPTSNKIEHFTLSNLANPVPASACYAATFDYWDRNPPKTIVDDTYDPYLAVKQKVFAAVDPAWVSCKQGIIGMLDPPLALNSVAGIAVPTAPPIPSELTAAAAPASVHSSAWPAMATSSLIHQAVATSSLLNQVPVITSQPYQTSATTSFTLQTSEISSRSNQIQDLQQAWGKKTGQSHSLGSVTSTLPKEVDPRAKTTTNSGSLRTSSASRYDVEASHFVFLFILLALNPF
ncbi:hypothetical protein EJ08DRAFT_702834 [Tothia fuscella]|uniref:Uncharacterized protein n=1 Tax=Tothia fuscella TaxID=1048955 RepID=A0A9P4TS75_9PEZI|nr:hypothetical protein EJ08DRAFT_702834 [Tothia fuscella]